MHRVLIIACCVVSVSFSTDKFFNTSQTPENPASKNRTLLETLVKTVTPKSLKKLDGFHQIEKFNSSAVVTFNKTEISNKDFQHPKVYYNKSDEQRTFPILHKIHARITRSKDAVWATITLTFMCVLLVLAVAQSRMWKDHYYSESQGVPLPNFNERVLFKDVMEHKISSLKKFFKKKPKENVSELESLLPTSEWDD